MSARFSPDGLYYWDGVQWVSTISHDGRSRWDGARWVPLDVPACVPYAESPPARQPTSWTRPLQIAVIAYYAFGAVYAVTLPFTMGGVMSNAINQSLQQQQGLYATPPPADFAPFMNAMFTYVFAVTAIFVFAVAVVAIIATLRLWTWAYYVILAFLALGVLGALYNAVTLVISSTLAGRFGGLSLPPWFYALGVGIGLVDAALFVWMLVALIKRGPWAMTRVAA